MVVDDEEISRSVLRKFLEKNDFKVILAENGQEALDMLRSENEVSAVLLDLIMPIMDGYETLKLIREDPQFSNVPVLVQTVDEGSERRALQLGANDYIIKPFDAEALRCRLWNCIRLRENSAEINARKTDSLTGLYSRHAFLEVVEKMVRSKEKGYYVLSCFDIDQFKVVNDLYGTKKGDEVLRTIGKQFLEFFTRRDGVCCRINADNFAILYPSAIMNSVEVQEIATKAAMINDLSKTLTFSVGRYVIEDKTLSASAMYDRAMIAKATIKGRYDEHVAVYQECMRQRIIGEQEIVSEMKDALAKKQFEVWFQPQYNHETGALIGSEALVRWRHPVKGLIPPGVFIPIFEKNGFVYEIDKFVWEQSCIFLRELIDEGRKPMPISVNISRYDIFQDKLSDYIVQLIHRYHLTPDLLRLEITESAFTESSIQIIKVVEEFKSNGFLVEIDDFGSGYSSLNTLKDVPSDIIKLDMKFLESGENTDKGGNIIASVIRMARWIGMTIIAEGVETIEQANFLKSIGCNYIQGYLYSKPLTKPDYQRILQESDKEETVLSMEKVETYDIEAFWSPASMETLIFNSFVGGACIFECDKNHVELLRVNEKYVRILSGGKMTESEILTADFNEHVNEENRQIIIRNMKQAIETKEEVLFEAQFQNFVNVEIPVYVRALMRVIARSGEGYLFYCLIEDISEQKIAEQKRIAAEQKERESAEQLRAIMQNINGGVSVVQIDDSGIATVIFNNDKYYRLFGYTEELAIEEEIDVMSLILREDFDDVMNRVRTLKKDKIPATIDYRCRKKNGEIAYICANASIMRMERYGEVIVAVVTDVTKEREFNEREKSYESLSGY